MPSRDRAIWALASIACVALLSVPALWNGFPLLQYDTGGYLARWYEGTLVPSRAVIYGLILNAGAWGNFWPVVMVQSALTLWVLAIALRVHGLARPWHLLALVAVLSAFTTLPWLTSILLTDIWCGLGVLSLYLIMLRRTSLIRGERTGLGLIVAIAAATHSATLAVLLALLAAAIVLWLIDRARMPMNCLRAGVFAIAFGIMLVLLANFAITRQLAWTPGGFALSFGRMLQDGIVHKYLAEHCPDSRLRLCAYQAQLPHDADEFFWGSDLFEQLGRFKGLGPELTSIALGSIAAYPGLQTKTAAIAFARQLVSAHSGEGVLNTIWHTYAIIDKFTPWAVPAMRAARQQRGEISFTAINAVHWPATLIGMALLPIILLLMRAEHAAPIRELAATVLLAILANAAVCGILSNPHDRYGARIAWLGLLAVLIAAFYAVTRLGDRKNLS